MFRLARRPLALGAVLALALVSASASSQTLVNINTASADELRTLPGIGPSKANSIIEYRESHGGFAAVEQITEVNGIGSGTYDNIRSMITVGDVTVQQGQFDAQPAIDLSSPAPTGSNNPAPADNSPSGSLININTADASTLQTLPGIGPSKAGAIIEHRNANGPFASVDQLDDVPGIGPSTLNTLRPLVTIE